MDLRGFEALDCGEASVGERKIASCALIDVEAAAKSLLATEARIKTGQVLYKCACELRALESVCIHLWNWMIGRVWVGDLSPVDQMGYRARARPGMRTSATFMLPLAERDAASFGRFLKRKVKERTPPPALMTALDAVLTARITGVPVMACASKIRRRDQTVKATEKSLKGRSRT